MKLKLENQGSATILKVTETIEASHLPILKAGLTKLFHDGKKAIVLDFTGVAEKDFKDPALFPQLAELRGWAESFGAQLAIAATIVKIAHAHSMAEALTMVSAPPTISTDLSPAEQEKALTTQLKQLEQRKAELEKKVGGAGGDDLKKLQQMNSKLKKNIAAAEKFARKYLKLRNKEPAPLGAWKAKQDNLTKLVDGYLQAESLLK